MEDSVLINGINGLTGEYLVGPLGLNQIADLARGRTVDASQGNWFKHIWATLKRPFMGLPLDVDPTNVARAGWALVFSTQTPPEVKAALEPLLAHRRRTVPPDRCKVLEHRPGEGMKTWLQRYGVVSGNVQPTRVPYYVTLVGPPEHIPFQFQYLLDIEYAVGRLAFDKPEHYAHYAQSVIDYEMAAAVPTSREVAFWGPRHLADRSTQLSADYLIKPLANGIPAQGDDGETPPITGGYKFRQRVACAANASKAALAEMLNANNGARPSILFTASHGVGFPKGDPRQLPAQGALLCQDWPGFGAMSEAHYLSSRDVSDDARVHGLVAFFFACYGAGTPALDNFMMNRNQEPLPIADTPFVASLPQRLLAHPNGSALAVVGHVERAWGYSIRPPGVGAQLTPFRNFLGRVMAGEPVGHATKDFSEKYAVLSADLLSKLDKASGNPPPKDDELAWAWVERNDAQNYVVLGDPAARLRESILR
jgi:hypothetical protein